MGHVVLRAVDALHPHPVEEAELRLLHGVIEVQAMTQVATANMSKKDLMVKKDEAGCGGVSRSDLVNEMRKIGVGRFWIWHEAMKTRKSSSSK